MVEQIYIGGLIGAITVAGVWHIAGRELSSHLSDERTPRAVTTLRTCRSYRRAAILLVAFLVYTNFLLFFHFDTREAVWTWIKPTWLVATTWLAMRFVWRAFLERIQIHDRGLCLQTPVRSRTIQWIDLERVDWDAHDCSLRLIGPDGKITVSAFMVGLGTLLEQIARNAPQVDLRGVRSTLEELSQTHA